MRPGLILLLLAGAAWADTSGPRKSRETPLAAERLGNLYSYLREESDRGLDVEAWHNLTLDRVEFWHKPSPEAYFVRVDGTTYVLGIHAGGEWKTDPSLRLVHRRGGWTRVKGSARN